MKPYPWSLAKQKPEEKQVVMSGAHRSQKTDEDDKLVAADVDGDGKMSKWPQWVGG